MTEGRRVLIVGGAACGPKTAGRLKRIEPSARITILERGEDISFGACGMPYFIGGSPRRIDALSETPIGVKRTPGFFKKVKGIEVRTGMEVLSVDREKKSVKVREVATGTEFEETYDKLVLATGSRPVHPPIPGIDLEGVQSFHSLRDAATMDAFLKEREVKSAVLVGAGLIGIEVAEALVRRKVKVTVVEQLGWIMPALFDEEMGRLAGKHLTQKGVALALGGGVEEFIAGEDGKLTAVRAGGEEIAADLAVVAIGVRPNDELATGAGLDVHPRGGILVDKHGRTSDPDIYAGGDCVLSHIVAPAIGDTLYAPQGSTANKQGRIIANHIHGLDESFPGVLGTVVCQAFDFTLARTGLSESQARAKGIDVVCAIGAGPDRPHYMPGAAPIVVKLVVDRKTRTLLGAQIVGPGDAAKRLDVVVTALTFGATLEQFAHLDLGYAPPFAGPIDVLLTTAHIVQNKLDGFAVGLDPLAAQALFESGEAIPVDARSDDEFFEVKLPFESTSIPLGALREKGSELPKGKKLVGICKIGMRGYEAQRILQDLGYEDVAFLEGGIVGWPFNLDAPG
jgi:NADPH-dependent 2,4-dienoyl-CoA reductase/sulfur reductase-like enzyme/rhodanese-related sulfurtransferase